MISALDSRETGCALVSIPGKNHSLLLRARFFIIHLVSLYNQIKLRKRGPYSHFPCCWCMWTSSILKKQGLLLATPRATFTYLFGPPNFPRASYLDEHVLAYEPMLRHPHSASPSRSIHGNHYTPKESCSLDLLSAFQNACDSIFRAI